MFRLSSCYCFCLYIFFIFYDIIDILNDILIIFLKATRMYLKHLHELTRFIGTTVYALCNWLSMYQTLQSNL